MLEQNAKLEYNSVVFMEYLNYLTPVAFLFLATASVVCALGMIFNPNLVRAGFTLIGSFVAIAGLYFMLYANFVGVSQILIYAVGIVLVIVFSIMLCSLKDSTATPPDDETTIMKDINKRRVVAFVICTGVFALLSFIVNSQDWTAIAHLSGAEMHLPMISEVSRTYTAQIGYLMLNKYILPFELISVLLLVVLVGVIILSKKDVK